MKFGASFLFLRLKLFGSWMPLEMRYTTFTTLFWVSTDFKWACPVQRLVDFMNVLLDQLNQWLTFKLLRTTYLVGKNKVSTSISWPFGWVSWIFEARRFYEFTPLRIWTVPWNDAPRRWTSSSLWANGISFIPCHGAGIFAYISYMKSHKNQPYQPFM